jgi:hypothetical protein
MAWTKNGSGWANILAQTLEARTTQRLRAFFVSTAQRGDDHTPLDIGPK